MIRTYELSHESKTPLYVQLYEAIRADILSGSLPGGEKLPSKRALAEHLSLSKITIETAYAQLLDEGYLTSRERSGYFVAHMPLLAKAPARYEPETAKAPEPEPQQKVSSRMVCGGISTNSGQTARRTARPSYVTVRSRVSIMRCRLLSRAE